MLYDNVRDRPALRHHRMVSSRTHWMSRLMSNLELQPSGLGHDVRACHFALAPSR